MNKYVIMSSELTEAKTRRLANFLQEQGVKWAHWFEGAWLIADTRDRGAVWWRDQLMEVVGQAELIVVALPSETEWQAYVKPERITWLRKNWMR